MSKDSIGGMLETTIGKIKDVIGSETVIGDPIKLPGGATAIPVSKVSFGFGSGGADVGQNGNFGGGLGGGVTVTPVAFLLCSAEGNVRLLQLSERGGAIDNIINQAPEMLDKVVGAFGKKTPTVEAEAVTEEEAPAEAE